VTGKILDRMSELRTFYEDKTKNTSDLQNYDTEFKALSQQLQSISTEKFNGIALFSSNSLSIVATEDHSTSSAISVNARDLSNTTTGISLLNTGTASMMSSSGAISLANITDAIKNIATMRANNGAEQSRLGFAQELLTANKANLEAANSRITDVDVASESTQLARWNILTQSGTAMLAQANQSAQSALRLLG
jgi:flagellin